MKPSRPVKSKKLPVTLDPETQVLLAKLQRKYNLSAAALVRMCIRLKAERDGLLDPDDFD